MTKKQAIDTLKIHWAATKDLQLSDAIETAIRLLSAPAKPKRKRFKWIRLKPEKRRAAK